MTNKITAGLFISLDGVVEDPEDWQFPHFNDEMGAAVSATIGAADTLLFGRKTYDSFARSWPARTLFVHPIGVHKGTRLFDEGEPRPR